MTNEFPRAVRKTRTFGGEIRTYKGNGAKDSGCPAWMECLSHPYSRPHRPETTHSASKATISRALAAELPDDMPQNG